MSGFIIRKTVNCGVSLLSDSTRWSRRSECGEAGGAQCGGQEKQFEISGITHPRQEKPWEQDYRFQWQMVVATFLFPYGWHNGHTMIGLHLERVEAKLKEEFLNSV